MRTINFKALVAIVKSENAMAMPLFYKEFKDSQIWFDHCFNPSDETNREIVSELLNWLRFYKVELAAIMERVEPWEINAEVRDIIDQDIHQLEIEQQLDSYCNDGYTHQDKYAIYYNEY